MRATKKTTTAELRIIALNTIADRSQPDGIIALAQDWLRQNPEPTPLPGLTTRQREVFDFVRSTIATRQTSPTVREIGTKLGISSPNGVMCHLRALEKKRVIERMERTSRGVRIAEAYRN